MPRCGPRMAPLKHLSEPLAAHMSIDLGGGDVGMPQHHLDRSQVRTENQLSFVALFCQLV